MIGILDYGLGNINAFINIFNQLHKPSKSVKFPDDVKEVSHLILPGVGSFDLAIQYLRDNALIEPLNEYALRSCRTNCVYVDSICSEKRRCLCTKYR